MGRSRPSTPPDVPVRWLLLDLAPRVLPELDESLSHTASRVLRERGVEVRTGQSVAEALPGKVRLTNGEEVPTRTLVWCVGVRPDPLVDVLDLPTDHGRLVVGTDLAVPGHPEILACGVAGGRSDPWIPLFSMPGNRERVAADWLPDAVLPRHVVQLGMVRARHVPLDAGQRTLTEPRA